jgi:protein TonB
MESGAEATLPLPQEDRATFLLTDDDPQQLIISANTRESVAAAYLDAWKRRIEAVGAAYLPELGELKNLTGSPTMLVRISETGELLEAHVSRSSGSPILDLASVDIIQRASPFDEFPPAMADEYNKVAFEYKFLFAERLVQRD